MPLRSYIHDVGVRRMDDHFANVVRLAQSNVRKGFAAINRLVNTVAPRYAVAYARLAGTYPNDVRVRLMDLYIPDVGGTVAFENWCPCRACISRLEHAT